MASPRPTSSDPGPWLDGLASRAALALAGIDRHVIARAMRAQRWCEPLPGIISVTTGELAPRRWRRAALLLGGPDAVLSHATAGAAWGLCPDPQLVVITIPHGAARPSAALVEVHQSRRPTSRRMRDGLPYTTPARTAIDLGLAAEGLDDARGFLARVVQRRLARPEDLAGELDVAPRRGSHVVRLALAEVLSGARSPRECALLRLLETARLPRPVLNARIATAEGTFYVDALWQALRAGLEVDGRTYHLDAVAWQRDLARQNALHSSGIVLLRLTGEELQRDPARCARTIRRFLLARAAELGVPLAA